MTRRQNTSSELGEHKKVVSAFFVRLDFVILDLHSLVSFQRSHELIFASITKVNVKDFVILVV